MRENCVYFRKSGKPIFHQLDRAFSYPLAISASQDFDSRKVLEDIVHALVAIYCRGRTFQSRDNYDVALALKFLSGSLRNLFSHGDVTLADEQCLIARYIAIEHDQREIFLHHRPSSGHETSRLYGAHNYCVDTLGKKIPDVIILLGNINMAIRNDQTYVRMPGSFRLQRLEHRDPPRMIKAGLGEADRKLLRLAPNLDRSIRKWQDAGKRQG